MAAIYWKTPEPVAAKKKCQALLLGVLVSQLVILPFAWQIAKSKLFGRATERNVQQDAKKSAG